MQKPSSFCRTWRAAVFGKPHATLVTTVATTLLLAGTAVRLHAGTLSAVNDNAVAMGMNSSAYVTLPTITTLGGATTMEGWVNLKSYVQNCRIVESGNGTPSDNLTLLASDGTTGKPGFYIMNGGSATAHVTAPNAIPLNTWVHVAAVVETSLTVRLFVDGVEVATSTTTALPTTISRSTSYLGKSLWSVDALFDGSLAEVRLWNVARSQTQIQAGMVIGSVASGTTGLVADYQMGAAGGSPVADSSGNGLNGTLSGNPTYTKLLTGTLANSGAFTGGSSVVLSNGNLTLSGANTYSGGTIVNSGILKLGSPTALGSGTLTMNSGSLDSSTANLVCANNNAQSWVGDWSFVGSQSLSLGSGAVTLSGSRNLTVSASSLTVGGVISGSGALTKSGAGALALSAVNTYSGGTVVNGGNLVLTDFAGNGNGVIRGALTINNGATVIPRGNLAALGWSVGANVTSVTINNSSLIATNNQHFFVQPGQTTGNLTLNGGLVQNNGGVSSSTTGNYFEWGNYAANVVSNPVTSEIGGRIRLRADALATTTFTVASGATNGVDLLVSAAITDDTGGSFGTANIAKSGAGTMVLTGTNTYAGTTTINAGVLQLGNSGTTGSLGSGSVANSGTLLFKRSDAVTVANTLTGSGVLAQSGGGKLTLSGANNYSGSLT